MKEKVNFHPGDGLHASNLEIKQEKVLKNFGLGAISESPGGEERLWQLFNFPSQKQFTCKCLSE